MAITLIDKFYVKYSPKLAREVDAPEFYGDLDKLVEDAFRRGEQRGARQAEKKNGSKSAAVAPAAED